MRRLPLVLVLGLAGCSGEVAEGKEAVEQLLVDPESAQWRKVSVHSVGSYSLVCGEVNFKNRLGGYVGFTNFVARNGTARIGEILPLELRISTCCSVADTAQQAEARGISIAEAEAAVRDVCGALRL